MDLEEAVSGRFGERDGSFWSDEAVGEEAGARAPLGVLQEEGGVADFGGVHPRGSSSLDARTPSSLGCWGGRRRAGLGTRVTPGNPGRSLRESTLGLEILQVMVVMNTAWMKTGPTCQNKFGVHC